MQINWKLILSTTNYFINYLDRQTELMLMAFLHHRAQCHLVFFKVSPFPYLLNGLLNCISSSTWVFANDTMIYNNVGSRHQIQKNTWIPWRDGRFPGTWNLTLSGAIMQNSAGKKLSCPRILVTQSADTVHTQFKVFWCQTWEPSFLKLQHQLLTKQNINPTEFHSLLRKNIY